MIISDAEERACKSVGKNEGHDDQVIKESSMACMNTRGEERENQ